MRNKCPPYEKFYYDTKLPDEKIIFSGEKYSGKKNISSMKKFPHEKNFTRKSLMKN